MPIYEYVCKECGTDFEQLVMGESTTVACPKCDSDKLMKKFSAFGMSVSGSSPAAKPSGHTHSGACGCGNPNPCGRFPTN
jgi:putative FmdB family regulatory protein